MIENLSLSVGPTFATVPTWKIRHTTVIGWGRGVWVGRVGWLGVGGVGFGGLGRVGNPPTPIPRPQPFNPNSTNPTPLDFNPSNPNPPDPNLSPLCGESSTLTLLQTFVRRLHSNSRSHLLHGESSLWQIFHVVNPMATFSTTL